MDVTCEECGVEATIAHPETDGDPEQDGWLYETEETQTTTTVTTPAGVEQEVPYTYQKPVSRSIVWLCPNGHTNVLTEEIADA
jgi:hypothetical protein